MRKIEKMKLASMNIEIKAIMLKLISANNDQDRARLQKQFNDLVFKQIEYIDQDTKGLMSVA